RSRERSPEYREKIAETLRGRTIPPEVREKIGAAQRGIKKGPKGPMSLDQRKAMCSLSDDEVVQVLNLRLSGMSHDEIGRRTGINRQLSQDICSRKRYEWVAPHIVVPSFRRNRWDDEGFKE